MAKLQDLIQFRFSSFFSKAFIPFFPLKPKNHQGSEFLKYSPSACQTWKKTKNVQIMLYNWA